VVGASVAGFDSRIGDGTDSVVVLEPRNVTVEVVDGAAPNEVRIRLRGVSASRAGELAAGFRSANPGVLGASVVSGDGRSAVVAFQLVQPPQARPQVAEVTGVGAVIRFGGDAPALARAEPRAVQPAPAPAVVPAPAAAAAPAQPLAVAPVSSAAPETAARPMVLSRPAGASPAQPLAAGRNLGLLEGLKLAEQNDPKLAAARREFAAQSEAVPQALAGLRPSVVVDGQMATNDQRVRPLSGTTTSRDFSGRDLSLTVTQPLFRKAAWVQLQQSEKAVEQGRVALEATQQELQLRYMSAYLNVLAGQDSVALARAEREALEKQLQLAQTRLSSGLANITEVSDTEGRYSVSRAREIEAANNLQDARMALREIVGVEVGELASAVRDFRPVAPTPADPAAWQDAARRQNLALQLREMAMSIAEIEIEKQRSAYLPTFDLVASTSRGHRGDFASGSTFTGGFDSTNNTLGVRVNVPLYQGGLTDSLVREAVARREKAQEELTAERRRIERAATQSLLSLQTSSSMIGALRKSVEAQQTALEAKVKGLESGLFTVVQVADAYRLMFAANRDFLQARYDYLLNRIKLRQAIGVLAAADLDDIAELLK
jgi:outer membrane protein